MGSELHQTCPECGAAQRSSRDCQSIFDEFLMLEFSEPGYGEVHMLTVACFMIQHRRYSDEALVWIEQKLRDHIEKGIPVEQIRLNAEREAAQDRRKWKVTRQPGARKLPKANWSMTIQDIADQYQDAASYCALVRTWARLTLSDLTDPSGPLPA